MKKPNWKAILHVAVKAAGLFVPEIQTAEESIEAAVTHTKKDTVLPAIESAIEAEGALVGKQYMTPRVKTAVARLNDEFVELHNALAEAHAGG